MMYSSQLVIQVLIISGAASCLEALILIGMIEKFDVRTQIVF
jgi:hypothetical protein